jgi:cytoskeleton protein RodZ
VSALGEEFRSAREARGLSLSDVAERLHIRSVYLAAIEDEDWHVIGAPVYVRGFLRTYARFLGLDPEAAVARFSATVPAGTPAATTPRVTTASSAAEKRNVAERRAPSLAAVLAIVVAAGVVLFVAYEFYQYKAATPGGTPLATASGQPAQAAQAGAAAQGAATAPPVAAVTPGPKRRPKRGLSVHVTETSWVRVAVDGTVAFEGTLPAGTSKLFAGKSADVRVGNAAGVTIAVNGKAVGPLGGSGDVVERRFVLTRE